ncbi:MAG: hypothetical protein ABJA78_03850 [Ferruginibacter sp.]
MKKLKYILPVLLALMSFQFIAAQTVDEIADKFVAAIGGKEKLMALNSIKMEGSMEVNGFEIGITVTVLNKKGARTDINVPGQETGYRIVTPTKGWNFLPFQGQTSFEEAPESQVKAGQNILDLESPFLNYKEKGYKLELLGKESINGSEAFKIKITNKAGAVSTVFIDSKTYYRVKSVSTANMNGKDMDIETTYSNFKKNADGYTFAYTQTNPQGSINYTSIELNKPVDESIFVAK